jgi:protein ImuA
MFYGLAMQLSLDLFSGPALAAARARLLSRQAVPVAAEPAPSPVVNDNALSLKQKLARLERGDAHVWGVTPFGDARVDACLPGGGLPLGRLHEIAGDAMEREAPAAAAGFAACLAQRAGPGAIVWALQRDDLYPPGLQAFGLDPDRLIFVRANKDAETLCVAEDALRTRGVSAVICEIAALDLTAARRLQLACERGGATNFVLRRRLYGAPRSPPHEVSTATTRWRIAAAPSVADEPGLGPPRWSARLDRCRGGRTGAWIMEAPDGANQESFIRVVAELADHAAETGDGRALSAGRLRDDGDDRQRAASRDGG